MDKVWVTTAIDTDTLEMLLGAAKGKPLTEQQQGELLIFLDGLIMNAEWFPEEMGEEHSSWLQSMESNKASP